MRRPAAERTSAGGWDDDWGDAFPAAPQTPAAAPKPTAYQQPAQMTPQPIQQPGAAFAYQQPAQLTPQQMYQQEAYPQQQWAAQPAPAPAPASGFMQPQQPIQQPQPLQFAGGASGGGSSVMGIDQAALAGAAAQAMGVDPGAASAMQQVATGMAMNYLGNTASATTAVASLLAKRAASGATAHRPALPVAALAVPRTRDEPLSRSGPNGTAVRP